MGGGVVKKELSLYFFIWHLSEKQLVVKRSYTTVFGIYIDKIHLISHHMNVLKILHSVGCQIILLSITTCTCTPPHPLHLFFYPCHNYCHLLLAEYPLSIWGSDINRNQILLLIGYLYENYIQYQQTPPVSWRRI